jgi:hypothetical protein
MITRTATPLICDCGKKGVHTRSENDQLPDLSRTSYQLHGFAGGGASKSDFASIFCPKCGQIGRVKPT